MRARQRAPLHLKRNVLKKPFASRRRDNSRRNTVTSIAITLVIFKLTFVHKTVSTKQIVYIFFKRHSNCYFYFFFFTILQYDVKRKILFSSYILFQWFLRLFGTRFVVAFCKAPGIRVRVFKENPNYSWIAAIVVKRIDDDGIKRTITTTGTLQQVRERGPRWYALVMSLFRGSCREGIRPFCEPL